MAHLSTSIPLSASIAVLVIVAVSAIAAAAAAAPPPSPAPPTIGMPECDTRCGNLSVPYPFGMGSSRCYHSPGFNLTCNRGTDPPRLLLGDGTLQVVQDIRLDSINKLIVRRASGPDFEIDAEGNGAFLGGISEPGSPYGNEFILIGCNVQATLRNAVDNTTISSCSSLCSDDGAPLEYISSLSCRSPIFDRKTRSAYHVHLDWIGANTSDDKRWPMRVLVATTGWIDQKLISDKKVWKDHPSKDALAAPPVSLYWQVPFRQGDNNNATSPTEEDDCSDDVRRSVCKGNHSMCFKNYVIVCKCEPGYTGNPYITDGCRDIDECNQTEYIKCYGNCTNTDGSFECHCPEGTQGNPALPGRCFSSTDLPGTLCNRSCGEVAVPYPFGMGPARCYSPGFNLTCDYGHDHPRLLLDDYGTLRVISISLENTTVHVIRIGAMISFTNENPIQDIVPADFGERTQRVPYSVSTRNELILIGCNVQAMLRGANTLVEENGPSLGNHHVYISWEQEGQTYSGCSSLCSLADNGTIYAAASSGGDRNCYGVGCCQARISVSKDGMPMSLQFDWIDQNGAKEPPIYALVAEEGWFDRRKVTDQLHQEFKRRSTRSALEVPIVLDWEILQQPAGGMLPQHRSTNICPPKVANGICRSKNSRCVPGIRGYTCQCVDGYQGNPYTIFGGCTGRRKLFKGIVVLIGLASGAGLIMLVLLAIFISKKLKQRRAQILKRKFFEKNRGRLLQQLVSQRADISERMIISLEELEKATNNFDKARELGGGGHGTVYKGILSDLHVVAIKKPKKVVQEEIEEFINEVAILSQINHRNVVKLYGCCLETEVPMLVYEFISNGTLHDHLHVEEAKSLSWDDRQRIAIETAKSIAHLHSTTSAPIIHRDIKSVNILLDDTLTAKVADFGASRYVPIDKSGLTTRVQGTIGYMDPMYFYTGRLTKKSDVYGFGVMLVELLTRQKPFLYRSSEGDGLVAHFSTLFGEGKLLDILDPQVIEEGGKEVEEVASLVVTCIKLTPEDRPTMRQVELVLESIQSSKKLQNVIAPNSEKVGTTINCSSIKDKGTIKECTRQYSMEQEFEDSARYPR